LKKVLQFVRKSTPDCTAKKKKKRKQFFIGKTIKGKHDFNGVYFF